MKNDMKVVIKAPSKWFTQNGPLKPSQLDQQHLSNIYWYFYIVLNTKMEWAFTEIQKRFDGKILVYSPSPEFKAEIKFLVERGFIEKNSNEKTKRNDLIIKHSKKQLVV
jgi:hypothetical protein